MAFGFNPKMWSLFCFVLLCSPFLCQASDLNLCSKIYKLGGSSALLQSPECSYWKPSDHETSTGLCQIATLRGRQEHKEDRVLCTLDLFVPLSFDKKGREEVKVGVTAVFDGYNGSQASDMASKMFLDMFSLHVQLLSQTERLTSGDLHHSLRSKILREAVVRSINDINTVFTADARARHLDAGSTATISLLVDGQILVINIGNSKTFLCSKKTLSPSIESFLRRHTQQKPTKIVVKELTKDHSPDREDENAHLPIARSIGAAPYARNGVISTPEMGDWRNLTPEYRYLVAATSSVVEKMSLVEACELLWEEGSSKSPGTSMADRLVNRASEKGSFNNLAAVVVSLGNHSPARPEANDDVYKRVPRTDEL